MQQRRLRLGDILDDYCPRERRITNHAVVAMIEDEVKQTRCTTCDADHEYKAARVPPPRRKRSDAIGGEPPEGILRPRPAAEDTEQMEDGPEAEIVNDEAPETFPDVPVPAPADNPDTDAVPLAAGPRDEEDGPVHRRLIRATLPRIEGAEREPRPIPTFTVHEAANARGKFRRFPRPGGHGFGHGNGNGNGNSNGNAMPRFGHGGGQPSPFTAQGRGHGKGGGQQPNRGGQPGNRASQQQRRGNKGR